MKRTGIRWPARYRYGCVPVLLVYVSVLALAVACSGSPRSQSSDTTLNLGLPADLGGPLDPDTYYDAPGLMIIKNVYEGLVTYEAGTGPKRIVPKLATEWTESPDGLEYTFKLRRGVKFLDGSDFDSTAVVASFARRTAVNGGPAYMLADVASVKTPDPFTAVVTLKQPNTAFLDYLASAYSPVMLSPAGLGQFAGDDHAQTYLQTHDLGTGPYRLSAAETNQKYTLSEFGDYWGSKPHFATVNLRVIPDESAQIIQFQQGQIDAITHRPTSATVGQFRSNPDFKVYNFPSLQNQELYINPHKGFLTDRDARVALLEAIDVESAMNDLIGLGMATAARQMSPSGMVDEPYAQQSIAYDPTRLREIAAKLPADQKGIEIVYTVDAADDQLVAERIGAQLKEAGLEPTVRGVLITETYDWVGNVDAAQKGPNLYIGQFGPDARTPYGWSHIAFDEDGGLQYFSCPVDGSAELNAKALETGDLAVYDEVAKRALATGCWMNIGQRSWTMITRSDLKGMDTAYTVGTPSTLQLAALS